MSPYFFGNGCWILAKKAGNVLKGFSLVQFVFDIDTVFKGKVLLVSWNIFTHGCGSNTAAATPLNKLGKRVSPTYGRPAGVACFHGGNLTVSPSQESTPFQLLRRNASHFLQHTGAKPLRKTCHLAQVFLPPKRCRKVIFFGSF